MLGKEKITIPILNIVATLCRRNNIEVITGIRKTLVNIVGKYCHCGSKLHASKNALFQTLIYWNRS